MLVYLRKGETSAGFGVGTATAWRYVAETVALLAARSPKPRQALATAQDAGYAYLVIDGNLIPIDRVAADRPFYSGKHRKLRRCPWRAGQLAKAIHVLQAREIGG